MRLDGETQKTANQRIWTIRGARSDVAKAIRKQNEREQKRQTDRKTAGIEGQDEAENEGDAT